MLVGLVLELRNPSTEEQEDEAGNDVPTFEKAELESFCIDLREAGEELVFGGCFGDEVVVCASSGPVNFAGINCASFGGLSSECVCDEGLIIEVNVAADLCDPNFVCPLVDLTLITPAPTVPEAATFPVL